MAAVASYLFFDAALSHWCSDHPSAWDSNHWVEGIKQLGKAGTPVWLLLVWSCLTNRWRATLVTFTALILVAVSLIPFKALVPRCRPYKATTATTQVPNIASWQSKSFPSGDTAVAFAAATTLSFFLGRLWAPALFVSAGAVGMLRIAAHAHYLSDVLAGALLGWLCGMAALRWTKHRPFFEHFQIERYPRLIAALVLILVVPFVSPFLGMKSIQAFLLKLYAIPLAALVLLGLGAARRQIVRPSNAVAEGSGSPSPEVRIGNPKPDSFKEPIS
jgi:membrane-associated phospholipid phosphatase